MIKYDNRCWKMGEDQRGIVTSQDTQRPEKQSLGKIALDATLLAILTLGGLYGCWKIYDYADTQRREALRKEKQERQYEIQK